MKEGAINRERAVIAHDQAPKVSEPGVGSFDDPAAPVAPQRAAILRGGPDAIPLMRADQLDPATRKRFRNGSLSYGLSAIARSGFCRGRPA